jgi:dTMP kinase
MTGRFITLEGGEGAGKTTQLRLLAETLRDRGLEVVTTREPGGSTGAEEIRALLVAGDPGRWDAWTEALLHSAARRDHLRATVWPALEAGRWVVCDRFIDSTVAYQGYGHGLGVEPVERLQALVLGDFRPDLTFVLDLPVEVGLDRAAGRGGGEDRYERMDKAFHERLRLGYLDIARRHDDRCVVIDAAQSPQAVHDQIMSVVNRLE